VVPKPKPSGPNLTTTPPFPTALCLDTTGQELYGVFADFRAAVEEIRALAVLHANIELTKAKLDTPAAKELFALA